MRRYRIVEILDDHSRVVGYRATWASAHKLALVACATRPGSSAAVEERHCHITNVPPMEQWYWLPVVTLP